MKLSNHLSKLTILLAIGFTIGWGTANFFAAGGNEGKAPVPPSPATSKVPQPYLPPAALYTPKTPAANRGPASTLTEERIGTKPISEDTPKTPAANRGPASTLTEERIGAQPISEDISLSETVNASGDETDATAPSPEELAKNQPADYPETSPLNLQETNELESQLRLESENAVLEPSKGDEAPLEHERP